MSLVRLIIYIFFSIIFTSCDDKENILVQDAVKLLDQEGVLFLDVRTSQEFKYEGGIKNALLIPVNNLEKKITAVIDKPKDGIFILSDKSEKELIDDYGGQSWVVPLGIILSGIGLSLILKSAGVF